MTFILRIIVLSVLHNGIFCLNKSIFLILEQKFDVEDLQVLIGRVYLKSVYVFQYVN